MIYMMVIIQVIYIITSQITEALLKHKQSVTTESIHNKKVLIIVNFWGDYGTLDTRSKI